MHGEVVFPESAEKYVKLQCAGDHKMLKMRPKKDRSSVLVLEVL